MPSKTSIKEKARLRKLLYSILEKLDTALELRAEGFIRDRQFLKLNGEVRKPFSDKEKKSIDIKIEIYKQEALDILQKLKD